MNVQNQCIVWIHGVGETAPGYSAPWKEALDPYLKLPDGNYTEVLWSDVFGEDKQLNAEETLAQDAIHKILAGLPGFTLDLDAYVGEFMPYLVKPDIRTKVNARLSQALQPDLPHRAQLGNCCGIRNPARTGKGSATLSIDQSLHTRQLTQICSTVSW